MRDHRYLEPVERPSPPAWFVLYERLCVGLALVVFAVVVVSR